MRKTHPDDARSKNSAGHKITQSQVVAADGFIFFKGAINNTLTVSRKNTHMHALTHTVIITASQCAI